MQTVEEGERLAVVQTTATKARFPLPPAPACASERVPERCLALDGRFGGMGSRWAAMPHLKGECRCRRHDRAGCTVPPTMEDTLKLIIALLVLLWLLRIAHKN